MPRRYGFTCQGFTCQRIGRDSRRSPLIFIMRRYKLSASREEIIEAKK
jgi:hypothetical protein